jgi:hypothetical protein
MRRVKIAILYQLSESWVNVRSVFLYAKKRADVECKIILLPFIHEQLDWSREREEMFLSTEGVDYICWDDPDFDFNRSGFDAVIFTSPYDSSRPLEYHFHSLKEKVAITAYIPYGLEVGGGLQNIEYQYRQPTAAESTVTFVRSSSAKQMFRMYCQHGDAHVVVTGHPRLDTFALFQEFNVDSDLVAEIAGRKAVLWNAHFSFTNNSWSTFDIFAEDIFNEILSRPDFVLIFRPHPLLYKSLINAGIFIAHEIDEFKRELRALGIIVDERADHRHAFSASCALLTDAGSFLLEYLITGKPVLYLKNLDGLGLNEQGAAVVKLYHQATEQSHIVNFLDWLSLGEDEECKKRRSAINSFFYGLDGRCGQRVLDYIVSISD